MPRPYSPRTRLTNFTAPSAPTIGTVTRTSNTIVSIPFTIGAATPGPTSYVATSTPSITLTVTAGTSSPLTVTGTFIQGTSYTFTIAAVNTIGTGTSSSASNSVTPYSYSIGDIGPGGGMVFYDAGSTLSWGRYLEAAVSVSSPAWYDANYAWSGNTNTSVGTSTAIGTGTANTTAAVAQNATASRAVTVCRSYTGGGKTDWSLSSRDELTQLWNQRATITGLGTYYYWSSSEAAADTVYFKVFSTGSEFSDFKTSTYPTRPIRAF